VLLASSRFLLPLARVQASSVLCGMVVGIQTQPAVLAFAVEQAGSDLANLGTCPSIRSRRSRRSSSRSPCSRSDGAATPATAPAKDIAERARLTGGPLRASCGGSSGTGGGSLINSISSGTRSGTSRAFGPSASSSARARRCSSRVAGARDAGRPGRASRAGCRACTDRTCPLRRGRGGHKRAVQLVDDRRLADVGIARDEHELRRPGPDHAVEGGEQRLDFAHGPVELLGNRLTTGVVEDEDRAAVLVGERERLHGPGRVQLLREPPFVRKPLDRSRRRSRTATRRDAGDRAQRARGVHPIRTPSRSRRTTLKRATVFWRPSSTLRLQRSARPPKRALPPTSARSRPPDVT
jgi:hypothetical protein